MTSVLSFRVMDVCRSCQTVCPVEVLNLGTQPPSNLFLSETDQCYATHEMRFGFCPACGLAQLIEPPAARSVRSPHPWLAYNEPESHLDDLVSRLLRKVDISAGLEVLGVTYKDDSTLARLKRANNVRCQRLRLDADLDIHDPQAGLETVQAQLVPSRAKLISEAQGECDILVARHLLEHVHEPLMFLNACQILTKPGGIMVFEVPDCSKMLKGLDHCFLWEEHIVYFNELTLKGFFEQAGLLENEILVYPNSMEDSLVAIVVNTVAAGAAREPTPQGIAELRRFGEGFHERAGLLQRYLESFTQCGKTAAMFGAGHLTHKFINYYGLQTSLKCVIDDNQNKQGMYMPGSRLQVLPASKLRPASIDLCILGLNPESEAKVLQSRHEYLAPAGRFVSAFSSSSISINLALTHGPVGKSK